MAGRTHIVDAHPADTAARIKLGADLRAAREAAGMSRRAFAQHMGRAKGSIQALEERCYWTVRTLQWWARGLDLRFTWTIKGLPPLRPDALSAMYAAAKPASPDAADAYARAALVNDMKRARLAARLLQSDLARKLRITTDAVTRQERIEDNLDLAAAQRHIRGCGGWLALHLTPPPAAGEQLPGEAAA